MKREGRQVLKGSRALTPEGRRVVTFAVIPTTFMEVESKCINQMERDRMTLEYLPDCLLHRVAGYLSASDVFSLAVADPRDPSKYKQLLVDTLMSNLEFVLKRSSTTFESSDPLNSFIAMTKRSPHGSIVIR